MRLLGLLTAAMTAAIVTPAFSQSFLETHDEAARRRQAEQYYDQQRRGNELTSEKPGGLGEAPPSQFSNPRGRADEYDPSLPRECPPNQMMCR